MGHARDFKLVLLLLIERKYQLQEEKTHSTLNISTISWTSTKILNHLWRVILTRVIKVFIQTVVIYIKSALTIVIVIQMTTVMKMIWSISHAHLYLWLKPWTCNKLMLERLQSLASQVSTKTRTLSISLLFVLWRIILKEKLVPLLERELILSQVKMNFSATKRRRTSAFSSSLVSSKLTLIKQSTVL